jgi:hypothetical protein
LYEFSGGNNFKIKYITIGAMNDHHFCKAINLPITFQNSSFFHADFKSSSNLAWIVQLHKASHKAVKNTATKNI